MGEVERTREFIPNDILEPSLSERAQRIDERIEELRAKRESFDKETQFVGIRRLPKEYSVVEPFAYFDGPSEYQLRFEKYSSIAIGSAIGITGVILANKYRNVSYVIGLLRGMATGGPIGGYLGYLGFDFKTKLAKRKHETYFSYALVHENDFPKIERKKFNDVIYDFQTHRSLNIPVLKMRW